ncbi:Hypothetical_protein [Hexamita inflata]|uniref:Hypothetical_protein n=1 Tax=Hexamita inflata TaxID=28002 RepID=A0AA86NPP5_9EUKA|nr:Hypothetical protein HINF_LOCUS11017 [Hexamita inflata]
MEWLGLFALLSNSLVLVGDDDVFIQFYDRFAGELLESGHNLNEELHSDVRLVLRVHEVDVSKSLWKHFEEGLEGWVHEMWAVFVLAMLLTAVANVLRFVHHLVLL